MYSDSKDDRLLIISGILSTVLGGASLFIDGHALSWIAIMIVNIYLVLILWLSAKRTDDENFSRRNPWVKWLSPRRSSGLIIFILFLLALVFGYAGLYVGTEIFGSPKDPVDAVYISLFVMGFNDPSPTSEYGKWVLITQFFNATLLLVGVFPLLVSRISDFKEDGS